MTVKLNSLDPPPAVTRIKDMMQEGQQSRFTATHFKEAGQDIRIVEGSVSKNPRSIFHNFYQTFKFLN